MRSDCGCAVRGTRYARTSAALSRAFFCAESYSLCKLRSLSFTCVQPSTSAFLSAQRDLMFKVVLLSSCSGVIVCLLQNHHTINHAAVRPSAESFVVTLQSTASVAVPMSNAAGTVLVKHGAPTVLVDGREIECNAGKLVLVRGGEDWGGMGFILGWRLDAQIGYVLKVQEVVDSAFVQQHSVDRLPPLAPCHVFFTEGVRERAINLVAGEVPLLPAEFWEVYCANPQRTDVKIFSNAAWWFAKNKIVPFECGQRHDLVHNSWLSQPSITPLIELHKQSISKGRGSEGLSQRRTLVRNQDGAASRALRGYGVVGAKGDAVVHTLSLSDLQAATNDKDIGAGR